MDRNSSSQATLLSLEATKSTRGGFACLFSSSDEYETALIAERRAQGRYATPHNRWPLAVFVGCALLVAGIVLLLN
jgi:hypothetical protein